MAEWRRLLNMFPQKIYVEQTAEVDRQISTAAAWLDEADAVLIGAGAGLSSAAGLVYHGRRFTENFAEFIARYDSRYMTDMYSAGFYPFPTEEEKWGYWSKHACLNSIEMAGLPLYKELRAVVREKKCFIFTTNVDNQFFKTGFAAAEIFATQGSYSLIQCQKRCHKRTYDATELFLTMDQQRRACQIPSELVPRCTLCGGPMVMNLRCDDFFVEDENWHRAANSYGLFLEGMKEKKLLLLELGVGHNTPVIIRFPFEKMAIENENWSLVRINSSEAAIPQVLGDRALGVKADLVEAIEKFNEKMRSLHASGVKA
ncbi:MAG: Sir2 silent information regulator family NAD-dependent deacetylase [Desulfopila sp.]